MHWSFIFYLMYLWRSRNIYKDIFNGKTNKRACVNCTFFYPLTQDLTQASTVGMGKCLLYPKLENNITTLIVGMSEPNYGSAFRYALTARMNKTMCTPLGIHFSPRWTNNTYRNI
jgi:hypothetical protein